jgi:hypothetical protein
MDLPVKLPCQDYGAESCMEPAGVQDAVRQAVAVVLHKALCMLLLLLLLPNSHASRHGALGYD